MKTEKVTHEQDVETKTQTFQWMKRTDGDDEGRRRCRSGMMRVTRTKREHRDVERGRNDVRKRETRKADLICEIGAGVGVVIGKASESKNGTEKRREQVDTKIWTGKASEERSESITFPLGHTYRD